MMNKWIDKNYSRLIEIRHYLHQHPELGFEEYNTSDYLKNFVRSGLAFKRFGDFLMLGLNH